MEAVRRLIATIAALALLGACASREAVYETDDHRVKVVTVADGLDQPWSLAFLPSGEMLVSELAGTIRAVSPDGRLAAPLHGLPEIFAEEQGGVLDLALDPDFRRNRLIYFSFAEPGDGGAGTAVARARLDLEANRLTELAVIFRQVPKSAGTGRFGSRLVFARDGTLFVTLGERRQPELAQDLTVNRGQVVRIARDGTIPADNPFVDTAGVRPEIWSSGHRNPQGAALHPESGRLWIHEHGAQGGDEVNRPEAGKNYGWPVIAYGRHYSGEPIGEGHSKPGLEQPIYYWDPSIAPSGMAFYSGDRFPAWRGDLLVGALKAAMVTRLKLDGARVVGEERMLKLGERIRDVRQGPDGLIYLLTDSDDGRILRLEPAGP